VGTSHQGVQASGEFVQVHRFDHIVVRAQIEPLDALCYCVACGQHEHGRVNATRTHSFQHSQTILTWQANVEHGGLVLGAEELALGGYSVPHPIYLKATLV
jgi:hypothetical protein